MRLFFDSNMLTYIAFFEGFLLEGDPELPHELAWRTRLQRHPPDEKVMQEVYALRSLYTINEQARFDFLFSDLGLDEIFKIRDVTKRADHEGLLKPHGRASARCLRGGGETRRGRPVRREVRRVDHVAPDAHADRRSPSTRSPRSSSLTTF